MLIGLLVAFVALVVVVVIAMRYSMARPSHVTLADVPRLLEQLRAAGDASFAVLTLSVPDRTVGSVDLQLAVDGGRAGFDWVLCGASNEEEEAHFVSFVRAEGFVPELRELNDVSYYRVEDGDLARLCSLIVTKMYGKPPDEPLDLLVEGFEWPPETGK